jgi:hypothetical protein
MEQELKTFIELVNEPDVKFNKISGRLLHHLLEPITAEIDELCKQESDPAIALRNTAKFLGKRGASAEISQDQALLLLKLQPQAKAPGLPTPEAARREAAAKEAKPDAEK